MTGNIHNPQKKFAEEFSQNVGESVQRVELAELCAEKVVLDEMNISSTSGTSSVWGLVVFCEKSLYFYVSPSENYFTAMIRAAAKSDAPREQILRMSDMSNLDAFLPRQTFLSFLSYEHTHKINFSFTSSNGGAQTFSLVFNKKAQEVFDDIKQWLQGQSHL